MAAGGRPELVVSHVGCITADDIPRTAGPELVIAVELKQAAMPVVCSRAGYYIEIRSGSISLVSGVAAGSDIQLLDGFRRSDTDGRPFEWFQVSDSIQVLDIGCLSVGSPLALAFRID